MNDMSNMDDIYTVVATGDGASIELLTRTELLKRLDEGFWGRKKIFSNSDFVFSGGRSVIDLNEKAGLFIIKGNIVKPQPKEVVEKWTL